MTLNSLSLQLPFRQFEETLTLCIGLIYKYAITLMLPLVGEIKRFDIS